MGTSVPNHYKSNKHVNNKKRNDDKALIKQKRTKRIHKTSTVQLNNHGLYKYRPMSNE